MPTVMNMYVSCSSSSVVLTLTTFILERGMCMAQDSFRSGFAVTIGRPNVGKSTLLNRLVGRKVAIVSDKPQTTRNKIHCILTTEDAQVIFLDTPGIHKPRHRLGEYMVDVALRALREVDVVLFMTEAGSPPGRGDEYILEQLNQLADFNTPVFLILNKIDLVPDKKELLPLINEFNKMFKFYETIPLSALTGENLDRLVDTLLHYLPEGPKYYPDEMLTDKPEQFIVAELVREKVLQETAQEVPHAVAVVVEEMKRRSDDLVYVRALIYTEKESQKGILIGKNGRMLKKIGRLAREEIENLLGSKIYLDLWVKVKRDWRKKEADLRNLGYTVKD